MDDKFVCGNCGLVLEDWTRVEIDDDGRINNEYIFNFCPNCGEKINNAAKREGRMLILPCRAGDRVYIHDGFEVCQGIVDRISLSRGFKEIIVILPDRLRFGYKFEEIGKTIFLTRAEAEASLRGGAYR